jgi:hypothetical protein
MIGVLPLLLRWTRHAGTIDFCPALAAPVSPVHNIIFLAVNFFTLLVATAQQPGQSVVLGRLSLCDSYYFISLYPSSPHPSIFNLLMPSQSQIIFFVIYIVVNPH